MKLQCSRSLVEGLVLEAQGWGGGKTQQVAGKAIHSSPAPKGTGSPFHTHAPHCPCVTPQLQSPSLVPPNSALPTPAGLQHSLKPCTKGLLCLTALPTGWERAQASVFPICVMGRCGHAYCLGLLQQFGVKWPPAPPALPPPSLPDPLHLCPVPEAWGLDHPLDSWVTVGLPLPFSDSACREIGE